MSDDLASFVGAVEFGTKTESFFDGVSFVVEGQAITQGSMAVVAGRVIHSSKRRKDGTKPLSVKQWRDIVGLHARQLMRDRQLFDGPVELVVWFYLTPPKKRRGDLPDTKPDLDKLVRAIGDALEGVVYTQDSRIVDIVARKRWADERGPRVSITARPILRATREGEA